MKGTAKEKITPCAITDKDSINAWDTFTPLLIGALCPKLGPAN